VKTYRLEQKQFLVTSIDKAWAFFSTPENLNIMTPNYLHFESMTPVPQKSYAGLIIIYKLKPFWNIPFQWVTEIAHMQEPRFFVDEQRSGPYSFWHHQHIFEEVPGGIEITDIVHYAMPRVPFASLIHTLFIRPRLKHIFLFRFNTLDEIFNGNPIGRK